MTSAVPRSARLPFRRRVLGCAAMGSVQDNGAARSMLPASGRPAARALKEADPLPEAAGSRSAEKGSGLADDSPTHLTNVFNLLDHPITFARPRRGYAPASYWHEHIPF